jgi:protein-L-isoaspartate(D-aspartate) O-methyltransferase
MGRRLSTLIRVWAGLQLLLVGCAPETRTPSALIESDQTPGVEDEGVDALATDESAGYAAARERMVREGIIALGVEDEAAIEAMGIVPRHEFVPDEYLELAYANHPLPIGYGQTISQPYIVALMTQELKVSEGDRVLEIGTGSGYQAAVLAQMGVTVYSIEIIGPLTEAAAQRLDELGYTDVHVRHDDGYFGWEEEAPFDAVIVTAAPDHVPQPLLDQLKIGGVLVIPVGPVGGYQELWRIVRVGETEYQSVSLGGVRFVPLTRDVREE